MARAPRASVPASSGQGISRRSYQSAYKAKGGAGALGKMAQIKLPKAPSSGRDYGKSGGGSQPSSQDEDLYGDVYTGLDDVLEVAARNEPAPFKNVKVESRKLK